jgi:prephenate dehydratase
MKQVAFQGELGAYSELAVYGYFGRDVKVEPKETFEDVFVAVLSGDVDHGVVPIENSLAGSIHENYDLMLEHNLVITGEVKLRITHNLLANSGVKVPDIRRVFSHPQALSQCKQYLRSLGRIERVSVYDTAGAARQVHESGSRTDAAIASEQAAFDYGLDIIASGIESNHLNYTRFLVLSREPSPQLPDAKTSIVFSTKNIPGALFKSLSVFALRDIDLYKIESRPLPGSPWEYIFYLDFDGDIRDDVTKKALGHLEEIANMMKVLGSYTKGREIIGHIQERRE